MVAAYFEAGPYPALFGDTTGIILGVLRFGEGITFCFRDVFIETIILIRVLRRIVTVGAGCSIHRRSAGRQVIFGRRQVIVMVFVVLRAVNIPVQVTCELEHIAECRRRQYLYSRAALVIIGRFRNNSGIGIIIFRYSLAASEATVKILYGYLAFTIFCIGNGGLAVQQALMAHETVST